MEMQSICSGLAEGVGRGRNYCKNRVVTEKVEVRR